jgi:hypothetical protein
MKLKGAVKVILLCALLVTSSFAQTTNARLDGSVQDQSGAAIPGVKIVVLNSNTQSRSEVTADEAGSFVFPTLQPGRYTLTAEAPGFRTAVLNNIELSVSATVSQIVKMELGPTSESISVEATTLSVQTTDSQISHAVMMRDIDTLPQLTRSPLVLANFQPGVQIDVRASQDSSFSHINGLRQGSNNTKLDGVDVNDAVTPRLGLSLTAVNSDSVGEFRVVTEGGKAEYGRSAGGQIEMLTRSGTNTYHGAAYDYLRNTALNANDFFNNQSGGTVPKYIQNTFGASFGGPIIHNKTFIFGNYHGSRTAQEVIRNRTIPTDSARLGIFKYRQNGVVQSYDFAKADPRGIGVDPSVAKLLAQYPASNNSDVGDGLNSTGFRFNNPVSNTGDQFTIRGDHHLTSNHVLFLRWSWFRTYSIDNLNTADATFPGQPQGAQGGHRWGFSTGSNWTITPTLINEFVIGHQSANSDFLRPNRPTGPAYITNLFTDIQYSPFSQGRNAPVNDVSDSITKVWNNHTFKGGANLRFTTQNGYNYQGVYPNVTTSLANGNVVPSTIGPAGLTASERNTFELLYNDILGRIDQVNQTFYSNLKEFQPAGTPRVRNFIFREGGYFFQDDWRVNRKLTLNLGLRYEYFGVPFERDGLQGSIDQAASVSTQGTSTNLTIVPNGPLFNRDGNNFAPRFGFAYDPTGNGKMAIRGNWGIFYDRAIGSAFNLIDGNTPGFAQPVPVFPNQNGGDVRFNDKYPLPAQPPAPLLTLPATRGSSIVLANPNLRTGYVQSYALNVQRELLRSTILQVGYVGNRGVKLFMDTDVNQPKIFGDFLNAFKEIQAFQTNSATVVPASNVFVKLYGTPAAAINALGATNFTRGLVGTVANTIDRGQFTRYAAAGIPANYLRNYPQFNQVIQAGNNGRSYYDSLQVSLRRSAGDLQWNANYTWSKSMDNISTEGNGFTTPIDNFNLSLNKARSDFDRPHSFNLSAFYTVPFGRNKRFGSNMPRLLDTAIGGWSIGALQIAQSGQPFSVNSQRLTTAVSGVPASGTYAVFNGTDRNIGSVTRSGNGVFYFSPEQIAQFTFPGAGELGNAGRNVFRNPGFYETDLSLVKKFAITEGHSVSFRAEAYNLFNHPNFGFATANLNINNAATTFGKFSQTLGTQTSASSARIMQLALRYDF